MRQVHDPKRPSGLIPLWIPFCTSYRTILILLSPNLLLLTRTLGGVGTRFEPRRLLDARARAARAYRLRLRRGVRTPNFYVQRPFRAGRLLPFLPSNNYNM